MFSHIFINRFKCLVRNKAVMFWTLLFPIVLASLFALAFNNLSSQNRFNPIDIAVVNNADYQNNRGFQDALASVTTAGPVGKQGLFNLQLCSREQADELLKDHKIAGYIMINGSANLLLRETGMNQSIIKEFLDDYVQSNSAILSIVKQNPNAWTKLRADVSSKHNYLKEVSPTRGEPDITLNYYFALLAMACLYGSFQGVKEISAVQANLSSQGARVNLAPVHKLKILGYSLFTATVVHLLSILILIAYLAFIIKIDFGNDLHYILLAAAAGSMTGVTMGAMIGALINKGENVKNAVLVMLSMFLSFLAGLMVVDMKYIVTHAIPIMTYINPANLITDAFYSLYYYDTYSRFFTNIGLLCGLTAVFYMIVYLVLRRQRYASL